jgi:hypothetical protein
VIDKESDDLRDKFLKLFHELFGHTSAWVRVRHRSYPVDLDNRIVFYLHPITPDEMEEEAKAMQDQVDLLKKFPEQPSVSH